MPKSNVEWLAFISPGSKKFSTGVKIHDGKLVFDGDRVKGPPGEGVLAVLWTEKSRPTEIQMCIVLDRESDPSDKCRKHALWRELAERHAEFKERLGFPLQQIYICSGKDVEKLISLPYISTTTAITQGKVNACSFCIVCNCIVPIGTTWLCENALTPHYFCMYHAGRSVDEHNTPKCPICEKVLGKNSTPLMSFLRPKALIKKKSSMARLTPMSTVSEQSEAYSSVKQIAYENLDGEKDHESPISSVELPISASSSSSSRDRNISALAYEENDTHFQHRSTSNTTNQPSSVRNSQKQVEEPPFSASASKKKSGKNKGTKISNHQELQSAPPMQQTPRQPEAPAYDLTLGMNPNGHPSSVQMPASDSGGMLDIQALLSACYQIEVDQHRKMPKKDGSSSELLSQDSMPDLKIHSSKSKGFNQLESAPVQSLNDVNNEKNLPSIGRNYPDGNLLQRSYHGRDIDAVSMSKLQNNQVEDIRSIPKYQEPQQTRNMLPPAYQGTSSKNFNESIGDVGSLPAYEKPPQPRAFSSKKFSEPEEPVSVQAQKSQIFFAGHDLTETSLPHTSNQEVIVASNVDISIPPKIVSPFVKQISMHMQEQILSHNKIEELPPVNDNLVAVDNFQSAEIPLPSKDVNICEINLSQGMDKSDETSPSAIVEREEGGPAQPDLPETHASEHVSAISVLAEPVIQNVETVRTESERKETPPPYVSQGSSIRDMLEMQPIKIEMKDDESADIQRWSSGLSDMAPPCDSSPRPTPHSMTDVDFEASSAEPSPMNSISLVQSGTSLSGDGKMKNAEDVLTAEVSDESETPRNSQQGSANSKTQSPVDIEPPVMARGRRKPAHLTLDHSAIALPPLHKEEIMPEKTKEQIPQICMVGLLIPGTATLVEMNVSSNIPLDNFTVSCCLALGLPPTFRIKLIKVPPELLTNNAEIIAKCPHKRRKINKISDISHGDLLEVLPADEELKAQGGVWVKDDSRSEQPAQKSKQIKGQDLQKALEKELKRSMENPKPVSDNYESYAELAANKIRNERAHENSTIDPVSNYFYSTGGVKTEVVIDPKASIEFKQYFSSSNGGSDNENVKHEAEKTKERPKESTQKSTGHQKKLPVVQNIAKTSRITRSKSLDLASDDITLDFLSVLKPPEKDIETPRLINETGEEPPLRNSKSSEYVQQSKKEPERQVSISNSTSKEVGLAKRNSSTVDETHDTENDKQFDRNSESRPDDFPRRSTENRQNFEEVSTKTVERERYIDEVPVQSSEHRRYIDDVPVERSRRYADDAPVKSDDYRRYVDELPVEKNRRYPVDAPRVVNNRRYTDEAPLKGVDNRRYTDDMPIDDRRYEDGSYRERGRSPRRVAKDVYGPPREDVELFDAESNRMRHPPVHSSDDLRSIDRDPTFTRSVQSTEELRVANRKLPYDHQRPIRPDQNYRYAERDSQYAAPRRSSLPTSSMMKYREDDRFGPPEKYSPDELPPAHRRAVVAARESPYTDSVSFHDVRGPPLPDDSYQTRVAPIKDMQYRQQESLHSPRSSRIQSPYISYDGDETLSHYTSNVHYRQDQDRGTIRSRTPLQEEFQYADPRDLEGSRKYSRNYPDEFPERSRIEAESRYRASVNHNFEGYPSQHPADMHETPHLYSNVSTSYGRERVGEDLSGYRSHQDESQWSRRPDAVRMYEEQEIYGNQGMYPPRRTSLPQTLVYDDGSRSQDPSRYPPPRTRIDHYASSHQEKESQYRENLRSSRQEPYLDDRESPYLPARSSPYLDSVHMSSYSPTPQESGTQYPKKVITDSTGSYRPVPEPSAYHARSPPPENMSRRYAVENQIVPSRAVVAPPAKWQRHSVQFCDAEFDFPAVTNPRGWAPSFELNFTRSYGKMLESADGVGSWTGTGTRGLARVGCLFDPRGSSQNKISGQYAWLTSGATLFQQLMLEPGEYMVRVVLGRPAEESSPGSVLSLNTSTWGTGPRAAHSSRQEILSTPVTAKQWVGFESELLIISGGDSCSVNFEFSSQISPDATVGNTDARVLIKQVLLYSRGVQSMGNVYV